MIIDRLQWANRRRIDYAGYDVTVHIARVIADIIDLYGSFSLTGSELGVSLSQQEIGSLVGASKQATAKAMAWLREREIIETRYRKVIVRDIGRLRSAGQMLAR